ncbi:MAG: RNA polymerase sigma factor [Rhodococcus sp. (in: high G+C Gram-positive bacteria)]
MTADTLPGIESNSGRSTDTDTDTAAVWTAEQIAEMYPGMLRFARTMCSAGVAEDIVQETWIAVLNGIEAFEGRASLKTWVYAVLRNKARRAVGNEIRRRDLETPDNGSEESDPLAGRLHHAGHPDAGHWSLPPSARFIPEERTIAAELREKVRLALDRLPPRQQQVVYLRDVEGFSPEEVCELLGLDQGNQRILLHRGRGKLRAHIECYQFGRGCPDNESESWL